MERLALKRLIEWKEKKEKNPLIIQGARQVGKTWLMKTFGASCYKKVAYINFTNNQEAQRLFEASYHVERIISGLSLLTEVPITIEDTLIIFDEIQECEKALNALKFFNENAPQYAIIAAGSLLGVAVKYKKMSFPVGQVEFLNLYPLSFYEFLKALGEDKLLEVMLDKNAALLPVVSDKCIHLLKQYFYVGGMPEVVQSFVNVRDFEQVRVLQNQLLLGYQADFSKYTEGYVIPKIHAIWDSIPVQLAKENKKFVYKTLGQTARSRDYESAMEWLLMCGLVYKVAKITKPAIPLSAYEEPIFKLYTMDCGLLCAKASLDAKTILEGNRIFEEFKGALTEQYVLQTLKLFERFHVSYWASNLAEVDFVIQAQGSIIPIEVKASTNLRARSLKSYREKYNPTIAIRTSLSNFELNNGLHNLPLYYLETRLKEFK